MSTIGYTNWGLIPIEDDILTGKPTTSHPPMLVNLALDRGASIVLELPLRPAQLNIEIATTAVSAPPADDGFTLYTAVENSNFEAIATTWHIQYDGQSALFTSAIQTPGCYLKIHNSYPKSIIVTRVELSEESTA